MADGGNGAVAAPPIEKPKRPRWPASRWPARRRREREDEPIVTFSDLVWEHWRWERQRHSGTFDPVVEREYQRCLSAFQQRYGEITDAYWSIRDASGVALTVKRRRGWPIPYWESVPRFHASVDWATREEPSIARVLNDCGVLAIRVGEVLRGSSELIALRRVISVASHLLGFVDRTHGRPENDVIAVAVPGARRAPEKTSRGHEQAAGRFASEQLKELKKIEVFYDRAGNKQARIVYFWGMVLGYVYLVPLAAASAAVLWWVDQLAHPKADWHRIELVLVSGAAGPLGAILSVLTRIASNTGKFDLDYEVGRKQVRWLGIYRPLLGAIFGVATYLLLASGLLQTSTPVLGSAVAYYGSLAFLAGFFERFMKVAPGGAPTPMDPDDDQDTDAKASKQKSTT